MIVDNLRSATSGRLMMIASYATVPTAARALLDQKIGLLVVCGQEGEAVGVLSRLDLVRHLADERGRETLSGLMSPDIVSCKPEDDLLSAWKVMTAHGFQSMPVLDSDARPVGVLDLRDALKAMFDEEKYQEQLLENYIAGFGYN